MSSFLSKDLLEGRQALVCGASSGIGRATAKALADAGADVTVLARRTEALEELADEINAGDSGSATPYALDLGNLEAVGDTIRNILERKNEVHILINNCGGPPGGPILEAQADTFAVTFQRHVLASHALVQACLPGMKGAGYGRIINIISTSVYEPIPNLGVSNTIRGAMAGWAKSVANELPPGITINNVLPGFTDTDRLRSLGEGTAERTGKSFDDVHEMWLSQIPEGRLADPAETAATITFLASPAAAYIRGVSLQVDGGRMRSI